MFVLKNAWAQLIRHKWRTLLTLIVTTVVAFGSLFGLSIGQANTTATTTDRDALAPGAVVRMTAAQQAKRDGADPDWTKNYLSTNDYNDYYAVVTGASITLSNVNASMSIPVRQTSGSSRPSRAPMTRMRTRPAANSRSRRSRRCRPRATTISDRTPWSRAST